MRGNERRGKERKRNQKKGEISITSKWDPKRDEWGPSHWGAAVYISSRPKQLDTQASTQARTSTHARSNTHTITQTKKIILYAKKQLIREKEREMKSEIFNAEEI